VSLNSSMCYYVDVMLSFGKADPDLLLVVVVNAVAFQLRRAERDEQRYNYGTFIRNDSEYFIMNNSALLNKFQR
jgi:hypothetical protein